MPTFLDEIFKPFYVPCPKARDKYEFGQIFWAACYYPHQRLEIWRPKVFDPKTGSAEDFNLTTKLDDAFKRKMPIATPHLKTNEEFMGLRAKPRPVVLVQPPDPELLKIKKGATSGQIVRHLATALLAYSAEDALGVAKHSSEFVEGVRQLKYRQFMLLPKAGGPFSVDSILRLDAVQSIAVDQLEPSEFALNPEVVAVLKAQLSFHSTGLSGEEFKEWAALLQA